MGEKIAKRTSRRVVVVCNPTKKGIETVRKHIEAAASKHGYSAPIWIATSPKDGGVDAARRALAKNPDLILAIGGDGTVRAIAEATMHTGVPVGIIPRGTGNLLARNLNMPVGDVRKAVDIAFTGRDFAIDVASAETDGPMGPKSAIFLVMAGLGLDAAMAAMTNPKLKARIGWLAYLSPILQAAFKNERQELTVVLEDGQHSHRRQHTAIIGNCGVLTGGFLLMPEAKLDDGLLDVLALDPQSVFGWTRILRRVAVGSALRNSPNKTQILRGLPTITSMRYRQTERVEWHMTEPVMVQIDGDTFGEVSRAVVTVKKRAFTVRAAV
jgi:diacylglycerol kinase family enzyme